MGAAWSRATNAAGGRLDLGMGKRTFDTHLDHIYRKLGVRKRSGLVRVAVRWGMG